MYEKQIQRFMQLRSRKLESNQDDGDHVTETPPFEARTYLYMRAWDGDTGNRPLPANNAFWLSPDIEIFDPAAGQYVLESTLVPGRNYRVDVTVNNGGDLAASVCNVDLYITDFTVGFNNPPRVGPPQLVAAPPRSKATVSFAYTPATSGHRCLFARVWNLPSMDYPGCENADRKLITQVVDLSSTVRQIAQQNLDVIQQGQSLDFALAAGTLPGGQGHLLVQAAATLPVHLKRKLGWPRFSALTAQKAKVLDGLSLTRQDSHMILSPPVIRPPVSTRPGKPSIRPILPVSPESRLSVRLTADLPVWSKLSSATRAKLRSWRIEGASPASETMRLELPMLGLAQGEMTALHLWLVGQDGKRYGGATVLVKG